MIDCIYFLTISGDEDRINNCYTQKEKLVNAGFNNIEIFKNHRFPRAITKVLQKMYFPHLGEGIYSCAFGHVSIMREALLKGYEHVLICEDDISITNDAIDFIKNLDTNYPNLEYDSIKLYYGLQGLTQEQIDHIYKYDVNNELFRIKDIPPATYVWGNLAYIVNRKFMRAYIDYFDNIIDVADRPSCDYDNFVNKYGIKIYFHTNRFLIFGKGYNTSLRY